jgi:UDP:flavonoid glycosyltransferase YjiC (YdhE family)
VLPQGADQFANGEAARRAGFALVLAGADVTPPAITEAADRLLGDPRYAAAADAVRKEIDTMPRADDVVALLTASPAPTAPRQRLPARGDRPSLPHRSAPGEMRHRSEDDEGISCRR